MESRSFATDTDVGFVDDEPMNDVIWILDPRRSVGAPDSNVGSSLTALEVGSVTTGPRDSTEAASRSRCLGSDLAESLGSPEAKITSQTF